ncbi:S26 family signal peptidase [Novosphingobium sp. PS1R-30]|uniref:S26 family signal peptidase n=1 Tax=Novosphingobium anseongense TaxID=3133436 RepID=A0ABU8S1F8_9SPHN
MRDLITGKLVAIPPLGSRVPRPRWHLAAAAGVIGVAACLFTLAPRIPLLLWNGSASMPIGLYALDPGGGIGRGAIAVAEFPVPALELAASRGYLPHGVPAIKRVVAVTGDLVCSRSQQIFVNGRLVATAQSVDGWGRSLEAWHGCRRLGDEVLLLGDARRSFDGRYFGPIGTGRVKGSARLLWRW